MKMKIYTMGYCGWRVEDVAALLEKLDAVLVDVRMMPRSRWKREFNCSALQKRLGDRYAWIRAWGNRNYKGGPIEIVDFVGGVDEVVAMRGPGRRPVVLLCGCKDVNTCHRKVLAEKLAERWDAEVEHLSPPLSASALPKARPTPKLF